MKLKFEWIERPDALIKYLNEHTAEAWDDVENNGMFYSLKVTSGGYVLYFSEPHLLFPYEAPYGYTQAVIDGATKELGINFSAELERHQTLEVQL